MPEQHPEDYCHRCGGPNVHWAAPSPLWNAVMRPDGPESPWLWQEIICPVCFAGLAQEAGVAFIWRLYAVDADVPQGASDGRIWNPDTWLWDKPFVTARFVCGNEVVDLEATA